MSPSFWEKISSAFSGDPAPEATPAGPFVMKIEDVFTISGIGVVVTGKVSAGTVRQGDSAVVRTAQGEVRRCRVVAIEKFRNKLPSATAGDNVGIVLSGVEKNQIVRGDNLSNA